MEARDLEKRLKEFASKPDEGAQPGPDDDFQGVLATLSNRDRSALRSVSWPTDSNSPDYKHIAERTILSQFDLTSEVLNAALEQNYFSREQNQDVVAIAIRGAKLANPHSVVDQASIKLLDSRPDHVNFNCVLGFWSRSVDEISLYSGSTVPCRLAVSLRQNGSPSNMLPTGAYEYAVWRHKQIRPALRMGRFDPANSEEVNFDATVVRNSNDFSVETRDTFNLSTPIDNVHCSYFLSEDARLGARFSSWGCLTVRGKKDPSDEWALYQERLTAIGSNAAVRLVLLTGKELALHAEGTSDDLRTLRVGSMGEPVARLQSKLGISDDAEFGPTTSDQFTAFERSHNEAMGRGRIATGIFSVAYEEELGWSIF